MVQRKEKNSFGDQIQNTNVEPPVFILGVWRSGTTHLHNLLTRDTRFGYANLYQALNPHTFLDGGKAGPDRMDNMLQGARADVQKYVGTLKNYTRNSYPDLPPESRKKFRKAWAGTYEQWGYNPEKELSPPYIPKETLATEAPT